MRRRPTVRTFFHAPTGTATHLIADPVTGAAAVVDPALDFACAAGRIGAGSAEEILRAVEAEGLWLRYVLETHTHADHLTAADHLRRRTGAEVVAGAGVQALWDYWAVRFEAFDLPPAQAFDRLVAEGEHLKLGALRIAVLETPGHTQDSVSYQVGDALFVGDTLFMPDQGTARADFPGGDAAQLYRSISRLLDAPPRTRVFVGHDEPRPPRTERRAEASVAEQRAGNIHLRGLDEAGFVALRTARDATLAPPAAMPFAVQVNLRAGRLPAPSPAGRTFLRLPVAWSDAA